MAVKMSTVKIVMIVLIMNCFIVVKCSLSDLIAVHPKMELLSFDKCPDEGNGDIVIVGKQSRKNRTLIVENVNYTLNTQMDNNLKVKIKLDLWGNGGWRCNAYNLDIDNPCEALDEILGDAANEMYNHFSPPFAKCPRKPGLYCEKDLNTEVFNKLKIPAFIPGHWRIEVAYVRKSDDKKLGCYRRRLRVSMNNMIGN